MNDKVFKKLQEFFSAFPKEDYIKGEVILQAEIEPKGIYFIEKGIVRSYAISSDGNEITLNMFKPGAFFPMSWAIAEVTNLYFYEAMEPTVMYVAPKETVMEFLKKEPDILFDLLRRVYIGMEGVWKHVEALASGSSYTKLISTLVILTKRFGEKAEDKSIVQLKLSEQNIANYAGMSRETASRELQRLKKEGLVEFVKGHIHILDITRLEKLMQ